MTEATIPVITAMILFAIGVYGVLSKRDVLRILISVSVMLGSITLLLVSMAQTGVSQAFVLFIWIVEVIEIIIALSLFLYASRVGKGDIDKMKEMRW